MKIMRKTYGTFTTTTGGNFPTGLDQFKYVVLYADTRIEGCVTMIYAYQGYWYVRVEEGGNAYGSKKIDKAEVFYINFTRDSN